MTSCNGCGGQVGRDCFNPPECEDITRQMQTQEQIDQHVRGLDERLQQIITWAERNPEAVTSLLGGNAAVVPLHRVSKKGVPRTLVRLTYLDNAADDLQIFRSVVPIAHARIDKPVTENVEGTTT